MGVAPGVVTWSALNSAYGKGQQGQQLLEEMRQVGAVPGVVTWGALITYYASTV